MKDGATVNQAAFNQMEFIFPISSVEWFSHTLDNVGNQFHIPNQLSVGVLILFAYFMNCVLHAFFNTYFKTPIVTITALGVNN